MHPDIEALRPKLKEILYDCAVEIRATKAALYLYDGNGRYVLASEFGFKVPIREWADLNDPIVDRCGRGRTPFFVNGLAEEPRFSEILYESQTERMLVVPMWMRGQLVGLVDMRDKGGKQPFEGSDIPKGQKIVERIATLFVNKNVFGQRYISLSESEGATEITRPALDQSSGRMEFGDQAPLMPQLVPPPAAPAPQLAVMPPAAPPRPAPAPAARPAAAPEPQRQTVHVPRAATIVLESRNMASGIMVPAQEELLGETELASVRESLRSTLGIPGAVVALFSAFGPSGGIQELASRSVLTDEASAFLQSRLNIWLSKRGERGGISRLAQQAPLGPTGPPIDVAQLQKVFTAPVNAGTLRGIYLTVGFSAAPDRNSHELLAENLNQLQIQIEHSLNRTALHSMRLRIAEKIVEPDLMHYPELRRHSEAVTALVDRFAIDLALTPAEAEQVHLVAMVHDAGMRLLEYDRLYRKRDVTPDELSMLREHVFVGAAIVLPLLGNEVARAVLSHHERVDGRGYPHELSGDEIPFASRLMQICDAYAAMTDSETYQPRETPEAALAVITRGAGSQFDSELATHFVSMMQSGRGAT